MYDFLFTFKEVTSGSVKIRANQKPEDENVTESIENGNANFYKTEYECITLSECTPCESEED